MWRALVLGVLVLVLAPSAAAASVESDAARRLSEHSVYVDPAVGQLVNVEGLEYAARVASRTADGAPIKVAFVNVATGRLNAFRDRLFRSLKLGEDGAVVIATPIAVVMRSASLTDDQEDYILKADGRALRRTPPRYTSAVSELTYDVGLVIHNLRPGAVPRGLGDDKNLRTFSGKYPGELTGGVNPAPAPAAAVVPTQDGDGDGMPAALVVIGALVAAGLVGGLVLGLRRPRRRRG